MLIQPVKLLLEQSKLLSIIALVMGVVSGIINILILNVIYQAVSKSSFSNFYSLIIFVSLVISYLIANIIAQNTLIRITESVIYKLRTLISKSILTHSLETIETVGFTKLQENLTENIQKVSQSFFLLPTLMIQLITILFGIIYIFVYSFKFGVILVLLCLLFIFVYFHINKKLTVRFKKSGLVSERVLYLFNKMLFAIKELLLNQKRCVSFYHDELEPACIDYKRQNLSIFTSYQILGIWVWIAMYSIIGTLIFAHLELTSSDKHHILLIFLFILTPLASISNMLAYFSRSTTAFYSINTMLNNLQGRSHELINVQVSMKFSSIELNNINYEYIRSKFQIGPITFSLQPGEVILISGDNGSGKSTLIKLLSGLYPHSQGEIIWDGARVDSANLQAYKQLYTIVFDQPYLFENVISNTQNDPSFDKLIRYYLDKLVLSNVITYIGGQFNNIENLSQGQRKRLAFIQALIENRPIMIFDEWAADQDPQFKAIFYNELLHELKNKNKCIVLISHDEQYFHIADKQLIIQNGQLTRVSPYYA